MTHCKGCDNTFIFRARSRLHSFCRECYYLFELDLRALYRQYYDNPDQATGGFIIKGHLLYIHYNIGMKKYVLSNVKYFNIPRCDWTTIGSKYQ